MAAAHVLHYGVGVPVRKVPAVLRALTGVELSQGAISQDALRRARGAVGDAYHKLRGSVRASPLVHTDDTGWRVDGGPAFLMAFETDEATVYQVRARHRNEEVREVVPSDYGGVMVTDRGRSYDAQALSGVKQQKCLAHVLRSISEVVETKRGRGRSFGNRLSRLLREAMELRQAYRRGEAADFAAEAERLRREATYHLRDRPMSDADNWRLQNELGWHHDRGNLLRFLENPDLYYTVTFCRNSERLSCVYSYGDGTTTGIVLSDADTDTEGFQINLDPGENRLGIGVHKGPVAAGPARLYPLTITRAANTPATGQPTINGTAQVGEVLEVDTSGIADADGLANVTFSYQWLSSRDTEIGGATSSTYTLQASDESKAVKVQVSFTDDAGNAETLTSVATDAVSERPRPTARPRARRPSAERSR